MFYKKSYKKAHKEIMDLKAEVSSLKNQLSAAKIERECSNLILCQNCIHGIREKQPIDEKYRVSNVGTDTQVVSCRAVCGLKAVGICKDFSKLC